MKKILTTIIFSCCVLLIPSSIFAQGINAEISSKGNIPEYLEIVLKRNMINAMKKYNAIEGTATLTDTQGHVIYTISRDVELENVLKRNMTNAMKKYNAIEGIAILTDPKGNVIYKSDTIKRDAK